MARLLVAFLVGAGFSLGLGISEMTQPQTIIQFLDLGAASWSYKLLVVMFAAVTTYGLLLKLMLRRAKPVLAPRYMIPTGRELTKPLILGSAVFGVGWGLSGLCPGPALSTLNTGAARPLLFIATMTLGMWLQGRYTQAQEARQARAARQDNANPNAQAA
ncbi:YeeE/YedE family protein [Myxococcota bacterium]|nr:YeeE/YedE family protein [Myxococcota bacterium]MBU1431111.1 YeeE/YedE family protein [Myxococcota bacterium]MBU1897107.1 YeeE/YedE family protein [Myxococcota bacterium]